MNLVFITGMRSDYQVNPVFLQNIRDLPVKTHISNCCSFVYFLSNFVNFEKWPKNSIIWKKIWTQVARANQIIFCLLIFFVLDQICEQIDYRGGRSGCFRWIFQIMNFVDYLNDFEVFLFLRLGFTPIKT